MLLLYAIQIYYHIQEKLINQTRISYTVDVCELAMYKIGWNIIFSSYGTQFSVDIRMFMLLLRSFSIFYAHIFFYGNYYFHFNATVWNILVKVYSL